ncbi:hypothetical protein HY36_16260 [Hyphomonas atlantica]|uniref:Uncharacterized protein n=1 Tax=Hyphomonas atlantica TaxID=1280948 RepID=A0A059E3B9_9PROT|nr:hypothetical protein HY36_16260 [Hyphomonas atlantica]
MEPKTNILRLVIVSKFLNHIIQVRNDEFVFWLRSSFSGYPTMHRRFRDVCQRSDVLALKAAVFLQSV